MTPLDGPAQPRPKPSTAPRKRYRRFVASRKQWAAIHAAKAGPCRVCGAAMHNGVLHGLIHLHHVVSRADGGDDVADNIVPLDPDCHAMITNRVMPEKYAARLLASLTAAEYGYAVRRGGSDYFERAYGVAYSR